MSLSENGSKISTCACGLTEALPCRRPWARRWHRWMHSWPDGARWIEAARVRALARGEEEQRPCSVSREDALALFTQVSDAVFPLFAQVLNGQRPVLKVRQMKTRWGVCVPAKRQITFSLRLAEKPRAAVEYVVLHEYAHFVRADHSPAFWAVVARYMPDYKARRRLLAPSVQGGMESPEGPPPTY